jgi:hypothetical protein
MGRHVVRMPRNMKTCIIHANLRSTGAFGTGTSIVVSCMHDDGCPTPIEYVYKNVYKNSIQHLFTHDQIQTTRDYLFLLGI